MKKRKAFISTVCILLVVLLVLTLVLGALGSLGAEAASSSEIQSELDALEDKRDDKQAEIDALQGKIDDKEYEQSSVLEKKEQLDYKNLLAQEELEIIEEQIAISDRLIANQEADLQAAIAEEETQMSRLLTRMRAMEENGEMGYIAIVFQATSFSDLLTRIDLMNEVMEYDSTLEDQYSTAREKVETLRAEADALYAENEAKKAELETKKTELEADIEAACQMLSAIEDDLAKYDEVLAEEEADAAAILAEITAKQEELDKQRAAEASAAAAAAAAAGNNGGGDAAGSTGGTTTGSGSYMWPSYTNTITSYFGYRIHPISGVNKFHSGVDIGASYGSSIWAADGGVVTLARYYGGYGNCVVISHGNGRSTLYGHMSSIAVSSGQSVYQGQVIGYVGSTGNSTGPHIHFETMVNGSYVNPLNYF